MRRSHVLALAAFVIVTPALAQVVQQQPIQPRITVPVIPPPDLSVQTDPNAATKVMTLEEAQALIARLRKEKRELDGRLAEALARIDEMTKPGGSLVRAYCESPTLSRNTAGATENCAASGYTCGQVDGTCKRRCSTGDDCAVGYTCNLPGGVCEYTAGGVR